MPSIDSSNAVRPLLRHLVATVAYRAAKVLRDVPSGFETLRLGPSSRCSTEIVAHMADLMMWAVTMARGDARWNAGGSEDWTVEVQRFFAGLAALDQELSADRPLSGSAEQLIQGPLADALTHVGQLAMLRGVANAPVKPESYARADVIVGCVGPDQAAPRREFDGDASARPKCART